MILDKIVAYKKTELAALQQLAPLASLSERGQAQPAGRDFAAALQQPGVSLIAEVKRASPSRGLLRPDFDAMKLALTYAANGAAAISVLTDAHFFQGDIAYLQQIKSALLAAGHETPVLRKDFIFTPYQVYEARAYGADALLLIAAILSDEIMAQLLNLIHDLGMTALIEVHNQQELARVLPLKPRVVGINNRNLNDFSVDLATFEGLSSHVPAGSVRVAESGIHDAHDIRRVGQAGANAILVGEALVTAADVGAKVRDLVAAGRSDR